MTTKNILSLALLTSALAITAGCATSPNKSAEATETPDYVVRERNPDPAPAWALDFSKFKREKDGKGYSYYLGESGPVDDRIAGCDVAELEAKTKIAQQIAELITSKIATDKQGRLVIDPSNPNDPGMERAFEEQLAGKSIAFLSGVHEYGTYWERRDYSKSNGNSRIFECSSVVVISNKDMQTAIRRASHHTEDAVQDPDARAAVKEALKDVDQEFLSYQPKSQ